MLAHEGGWADNAADPGGATMKGITLGTYTRWRAAHNQPAPTKADLRAISDAEVAQIYRAWYWDAAGCGALDWPLRLCHFNAAVNAGVGKAAQLLAQSKGDACRYLALQRAWYRSLGTFPVFGRGWLNRLDDLAQVAGLGCAGE